MTSPEERFDEVVEALLDIEGVEPPEKGKREFGSNALKIQGRIFAMLVRGSLVVKLPGRRVASAIGDGDGGPFDAGKGRPMREWLTVPPNSKLDWLEVSREALGFVGRRRT